MELIASILGIFAVCFLLAYLMFSLDPEHFLLKLLLFLIFLVSLPLIPKVLITNADYCSMVVNSTTEDTSVANTTTTTYTHTRYCETNTEKSYNTLLDITLWVWRLSLMYMILFLAWRALIALNIVVPKTSGKGIIRYKLKK